MKKPMKPNAAIPEMDQDYQTQNHLRTLMDAEDIKSDPEKMQKVQKLAKKHKKQISSVQDLKNAYASKLEEEQEGEQS